LSLSWFLLSSQGVQGRSKANHGTPELGHEIIIDR